jgi:hypothetical protein
VQRCGKYGKKKGKNKPALSETMRVLKKREEGK